MKRKSVSSLASTLLCSGSFMRESLGACRREEAQGMTKCFYTVMGCALLVLAGKA
jgi:hypothetical protein